MPLVERRPRGNSDDSFEIVERVESAFVDQLIERLLSDPESLRQFGR